MKRIIGITIVAALIAGTVAGIGYLHSPKGDVSLESAGSQPSLSKASVSRAQIVPVPPDQASETPDSSPVAAQKAVPPDSQFKAWKLDMATKCASGSSEIKIKHFDVNNDSQPDTVCWRTIKTNSYSDFVDVAFIVKTDTSRQTAYIIMPVNGDEQFALCGPTDKLDLTQSRWTASDFKELDWDYAGPIGVSMNGTDCDPPVLFWPVNAKGSEVQLDFERM